MYKFCKSNFIFLVLLFILSCQNNKRFARLQFLVGTWQVEGKSTFEQWERSGKKKLVGQSYKMTEHKKQVLETLLIEMEDDVIVYKANVPEQNMGQTIPFKFNTTEEKILSFENPDHDFPKKIQYKKIDDSRLWVNVLGENDQGFSYYLIRKN